MLSGAHGPPLYPDELSHSTGAAVGGSRCMHTAAPGSGAGLQSPVHEPLTADAHVRQGSPHRGLCHYKGKKLKPTDSASCPRPLRLAFSPSALMAWHPPSLGPAEAPRSLESKGPDPAWGGLWQRAGAVSPWRCCSCPNCTSVYGHKSRSLSSENCSTRHNCQ